MNIYLAGPIDFEKDKGSDWRNELKELFKERKSILLFDPVAPYSFCSVDKSMSNFIYQVNMRAIDYCDVMVARMMRGQVSVGTPIELHYAIDEGVPIILCTDMADSVYMNYIANKSKIVVEDVNGLYKAILTLIVESKKTNET
jgi:nucleoside 2-deoxyribosyltransferase